MNALILMLGSLPLTSTVTSLPADSVPVGVVAVGAASGAGAIAIQGAGLEAESRPDSIRRRPRAIEYSDTYYRRLTIHRIGSYTMLPLFVAEYALGQRLLNGTYPPRWVKPAHGVVAGGLGVLFTVNTVTGAWNLWDARRDDTNRTRRYVHTGLMLASDAGFAWAGAIGNSSNTSLAAAHRHRDVAIGSIALSTAGTALMWFWRN